MLLLTSDIWLESLRLHCFAWKVGYEDIKAYRDGFNSEIIVSLLIHFLLILSFFQTQHLGTNQLQLDPIQPFQP